MHPSQQLLSRMGTPVFVRHVNILQMCHSLYIKLKEAYSSFQNDEESICNDGCVEVIGTENLYILSLALPFPKTVLHPPHPSAPRIVPIPSLESLPLCCTDPITGKRTTMQEHGWAALCGSPHKSHQPWH